MKPQRPRVGHGLLTLLPGKKADPCRRRRPPCAPSGSPARTRGQPAADHDPAPTRAGRLGAIRVEAFGLNRSELKLRLGLSVGVSLPRVPGIEAVGTVDAAPAGSGLAPGQKVVAMMGDMGSTYDGGYAEYTAVPLTQVIAVDTDLPWEVLGACRRWCSAYGSLTVGLDLKPVSPCDPRRHLLRGLGRRRARQVARRHGAVHHPAGRPPRAAEGARCRPPPATPASRARRARAVPERRRRRP